MRPSRDRARRPAPAVAGSRCGGAGAAVSREDSVKVSPRLAVETPSLRGSIALRGGRIDDLVLVKYHETVDPKSPNVVLFSPDRQPASLLRRVRLGRPRRLRPEGARPRCAVAVRRQAAR